LRGGKKGRWGESGHQKEKGKKKNITRALKARNVFSVPGTMISKSPGKMDWWEEKEMRSSFHSAQKKEKGEFGVREG